MHLGVFGLVWTFTEREDEISKLNLNSSFCANTADPKSRYRTNKHFAALSCEQVCIVAYPGDYFCGAFWIWPFLPFQFCDLICVLAIIVSGWRVASRNVSLDETFFIALRCHTNPELLGILPHKLGEWWTGVNRYFYHNLAVSRSLIGWCAVVNKSPHNGKPL